MIFNRKPIFFLVLAGMSVCLLQSCVPKGKFLFVFNRTSVKKPPKDTFVFANEIHISQEAISKDEQNRLESELGGYWDDSVKARIIQQFGIFYRIKEPQHFDRYGIERSKVFMNSYLQSQGYYNAVLKDTFRIDTFRLGRPKQQFRAIPIMYIDPGKRLRVDSVSFNFFDTARPSPSDTLLQQLAMQVSNEALLHKGDPYSKQSIAAELDRLVSWYRRNGYYRLGRENLVALVDTTDQLIDSLTIDPFELARRIAEAAERRRQNPLADIEIMQATKAKDIPFDSTVVTRYHIGNIYYYPELPDTTLVDSALKRNLFFVRGRQDVFMKTPGEGRQFRYRVFSGHTYMTKGELYNERIFYKTVNTFSQMGPWKGVEVRDSLRKDTVDFHIFLTPYKKLNVKFSAELTRSTGDFVSSNNLFGLGGNSTLLHRNLFKHAIQSALTARAGVELNLEPNKELLQTVQGGVGLNFAFPHRIGTLLFPRSLFPGRAAKRMANQKKYDIARSLINFNASYTERKTYYRLRSVTANIGDEWVKGSITQALRPVNIELNSLDILPGLEQAFLTNPFLKTAFNTGTVASIIYTHSNNRISRRDRRNSFNFRYGVEVIPLLGKTFEKNFYQYLKGEVEAIYKLQRVKSEHVFRGFAGAGWNYGPGKSLPFFKQFVAGGPNSMRAWGLRQLGLGSSKLSDTASTFRDRFGDLQFEMNYEWRFPITNFGSAKFNSALFADIGNIWNLKQDPSNPQGQFKIPRFFGDLAMAAGVGILRMNVANFIFRVDFALKLRDPAVRQNNGWLLPKFTWKNENDRNNYAIQIGIGMPF